MKMTWLILALCSALSAADKLTRGTVGETARIPCGTRTAGKNLEIWKLNGEMVLKRNLRNSIVQKGPSPVRNRATSKRDHLEIRNLEEGDFGRYICEMDGTEHAHILFIISVSASPPGVLQLDSEAKLQCRVQGLQPMPTLEWQRPDGAPGGGSGEVLLSPVARTDDGSWACEFSQDGETFKETLKVKVQGHPVTERVAATPSKTHCSDCTDAALVVSVGATEPPGPMLLAGLSLWVWVAVGVGCLVLLLVVGCVIALHHRNRRPRARRRCRGKIRTNRRKKTSQQPPKPKQYCQCDRSTGAVDTMAPLPR